MIADKRSLIADKLAAVTFEVVEENFVLTHCNAVTLLTGINEDVVVGAHNVLIGACR